MGWTISFPPSLNPVRGYRMHGHRYFWYVVAKLAMLISCMLLASITLIASFADAATFVVCYEIALWTLKIAGGMAPYLILESAFWFVRSRNRTRDVAHGIE